MTDKEHKTAHAPYNFIPLPDRVVPAESIPDHDQYYADRHTGYFDVKLTTETPLYIRGMLTKEEAATKEQHKNKPDFFQLGGKPIIPGSSLRGMIRNLVEIITFSKLQPITDRLLIYRAVGDTTSYGNSYRERLLGKPDQKGYTQYPLQTVRAGYLVQNEHGWAIQPAKMVNNESFVLVPVDKLNAAQIPLEPQSVVNDVYVRPVTQRTTQKVQKGAYINLAKSEQVSRTPRQGLEKGTLIVSGKTVGTRKYHPVIFEADPNQPLVKISGELWSVYETDRDMKRGTDRPTRPLRKGGDPLFYLVNEKNENELVFFGPTMMFRLPPRYTLSELIPVQTTGTDAIDMAEAMFGWVSRESTKERPVAFASRISVTNAYPTESSLDYYDQVFTPKILSGPKPTTFQHYLEQPDRHNTEKTKRKHYEDKDARLRGHKLYWRQKGITVSQIKEPEKISDGDTQHTKMRPVKPGVTFNFRVYFENLSNVELGALAWALTLPASADHRHQLGMGKPYGMGVVKLGATLTVINRTSRYQTLFSGEDWHLGEDEENKILSRFISEFETHLMKEIGKPGQKFLALERIKELCVMLTPQTQNASRFGYMELKDFKERDVLPYPSVIAPESVYVVPQKEIPDGTLIQATIIDPSVMTVRLPPEYDEREIKLPPDTKRQARQTIYLQKINGEHEFRVLSKNEWNELVK
ncbi:MAG: TIGR03986 family CRISPR-associated RAMP protein [Anaerolineae bacterium]